MGVVGPTSDIGSNREARSDTVGGRVALWFAIRQFTRVLLRAGVARRGAAIAIGAEIDAQISAARVDIQPYPRQVWWHALCGLCAQWAWAPGPIELRSGGGWGDGSIEGEIALRPARLLPERAVHVHLGLVRLRGSEACPRQLLERSVWRFLREWGNHPG